VVLDASMEVRSAVVYASFIVVLVCLPIFFMSGVAGAFFRPLATAYVLSVMASLVVALIVTPALCLILCLAPWTRAMMPGFRAGYARCMPAFFPASFAGLLPSTLAWRLSLALPFSASRGSKKILPQFQETDFLMHWVAKPGVGLTVMREDIKVVGARCSTRPT